MTTIVGNRGQLWTSTLSPHLPSPHLDFPEGGKLRRGENSGEGKTYNKNPSPKTVWDPRTYEMFPPPISSHPVILLRGNGHRPDESHFLRPPKLVWEGALYIIFDPPTRAIRFAPPFAVSLFVIGF